MALLIWTHPALRGLYAVVGAVEERIQFRGEAMEMVNVKGLWRLVAAATKLWKEQSVHCPLVASVLVFVRRSPGLGLRHSCRTLCSFVSLEWPSRLRSLLLLLNVRKGVLAVAVALL